MQIRQFEPGLQMERRRSPGQLQALLPRSVTDSRLQHQLQARQIHQHGSREFRPFAKPQDCIEPGKTRDEFVGIEDMIAEDDKVVAQYVFKGTNRGDLMGIAPTGRRVSISGTSILRIAGGMIIEEWAIWDRLAGAGLEGRYYHSGSVSFLSLWGGTYERVSRPYDEFLQACAPGRLPTGWCAASAASTAGAARW